MISRAVSQPEESVMGLVPRIFVNGIDQLPVSKRLQVSSYKECVWLRLARLSNYTNAQDAKVLQAEVSIVGAQVVTGVSEVADTTHVIGKAIDEKRTANYEFGDHLDVSHVKVCSAPLK
jgi:hypothetical protein